MIYIIFLKQLSHNHCILSINISCFFVVSFFPQESPKDEFRPVHFDYPSKHPTGRDNNLLAQLESTPRKDDPTTTVLIISPSFTVRPCCHLCFWRFQESDDSLKILKIHRLSYWSNRPKCILQGHCLRICQSSSWQTEKESSKWFPSIFKDWIAHSKTV